ncbi:beta-lactamase class A [Nakamurella sp. UYEF19]|uniref:serine hydrolase n=1 Tax=Nakamurella sp. UYEF19 TaxID=1756392 RepID=UPI0033967CAE
MTSVRWSISLRDADSDAVLLEENADEVLKTASIGKILLLFRIAELLERGDLTPDEPLTRTPDDAVADSGIWQYLGVDALSVGDLCELVGMTSDNLATNVLLRRVGLAGVASSAARRGMTVTALHDRVRDVRGPQHPATLSTGSAAELAGLMAALHRGVRAGDTVSGHVYGWLGKGMDLSQVASGWGLDPLAHLGENLGLSVVNKTGTDSGVRAEIGLLTTPSRTVAYAVLANWDDDAEPQARHDVLARQRELGLSVAGAARW